MDIKLISQTFKYPYGLNDIAAAYVGKLIPTMSNWEPKVLNQWLGIEVEVERCPNFSIYDHIMSDLVGQTDDGSLRNHGIELITAPHMAKYTESILAQIYKSLPITAEFSRRTSIHVHFNVRDLNWSQLTALVHLYLASERCLYDWVGQGRDRSIFCVPVQETNMLMSLEDCIKKREVGHWMKYTGLNLKPVREHGTIEFRHLYGTKDYTIILQWINLILSMFKYVRERDVDFVLERVISLNTNSEYRQFIEEVYQEDARKLLYPGYAKDIERGIAYLKTTFHANKFLTTLRGEASNSCELFKRKFPQNSAKAKVKAAYKPLIGTNDQLLFDPASVLNTPIGGSDFTNTYLSMSSVNDIPVTNSPEEGEPL